MFEVQITDIFTKKADKFLKRHPNLKQKYHKAVKQLEADPFHPGLRLHKLSGNLDGLYSVSLDLQYRITLELIIVEQQIILLTIGGHDEVY